MNAATQAAIAALARGEWVERYVEGGKSMTPKIMSREPVTLAPVDPAKLAKRDIVLVRVKGNTYTHLITALDGPQVQISNNHGRVNGWTPRSNVYGIVVAINGRPLPRALAKAKPRVVTSAKRK